MTIEADDRVLHGLPRIEGTRISVLHVYDMVTAGADPADVADSLDIDLGRVYEALAYYYRHPDDMRRIREEESAALGELEPRTTDPPVEIGDSR